MSNEKIVIYHNPGCSKSRETLDILIAENKTPKIIEYLQHPPDKETLKAVLSRLNLPAQAVIRTSDQLYSDVGRNTEAMTSDEIIDLVCQYPALLQRPIVVNGNKAIIGRPPQKVLDIL